MKVTWAGYIDILQFGCMLYLFVVKLATARRLLYLFGQELLFIMIEPSSLFSNVSILDKFFLDEVLLLWAIVRGISFILMQL